MRVLLVGIDAACAGVLDPLFEEDRLPTLRRLFEDGVSGALQSHVPPWTPSMWPSIYTGVNPGKHGVFGFLSYDGYDWGVVNATHVREHALWELLDLCGLTSVVVNVPVTHPPRAFDGALIPGYTAPEAPDCHPSGVLADVTSAIGEYRVYPEPTETGELASYLDPVRMRGEAFRYLCEQYNPAFGFVQFQQTDTVFHEQPGEMELVRSIYEAVDREIGETLATVDPGTVFVVSDHGIGEYSGYGFRANSFLESHGYLTATEGGRGMPSWAPIRDDRLRAGSNGETDGRGWIERAIDAAAHLGLTTNRIGALLDRVGLEEAVAGLVPRRLIRAGQRQIDFQASTAYMRARIELGVRINLAGREPDGVVSPEEYEAVRTELIELLSSVTTPDGNPVFEDVTRREAYFEGPYTEHAVDIVTVPAAFDQFLTADLLDSSFGPPGQPWNHKREGIFVAAGNRVSATAITPHVFDVAPTVLGALGIEKSDRMDGDVLPIVDAVDERTYPAYESTDRETTDDSHVTERLSDTGYLDQ